MKKKMLVVAAVSLSLAACGSTGGSSTADEAGPEQIDQAAQQHESASGTKPEPATQERNLAVEDWIKANYPDMGPYSYRYARFDLNGDGVDEFLVYIGGRFMCGSGGCGLAVLKLGENSFEKITETSVTRLPIGVLDSSTNGWHDIWVTTYGGGSPEAVKKLAYDGSSYPSNPTVPPAVKVAAPGTVLIEDGKLISIAD